LLGTDIYVQGYGAFEPLWQPAACGAGQISDN
jgi:hypothetical protein